MTRSGHFSRDDTLFGVCAALAEDFGFNPDILRVLIGLGLLFNPVAAIVAYAVGAALVAVSRWCVPDRPAMSFATGEKVQTALSEEETREALPLAA